VESKEMKTVLYFKLVKCMKSSDRRQIDKQLDGRNESYYSLFMWFNRLANEYPCFVPALFWQWHFCFSPLVDYM